MYVDAINVALLLADSDYSGNYDDYDDDDYINDNEEEFQPAKQYIDIRPINKPSTALSELKFV